MPKFNFSQTYNQAKKEFNLGKGEYFKIQEGQNRIRLVSECLPHPGEYEGRPNFKWICQVIDRKDGKVKPFFMPTTIYQHLEALQLSEDFAFDEVPMPYDIVISAIGAGTKEVKYTTLPGKAIPLTTDDAQAIADAPTVQELQDKIRENEHNDKVQAVATEASQPITVNSDDIPF